MTSRQNLYNFVIHQGLDVTKDELMFKCFEMALSVPETEQCHSLEIRTVERIFEMNRVVHKIEVWGKRMHG